jgi:hypothetical protein
LCRLRDIYIGCVTDVTPKDLARPRRSALDAPRLPRAGNVPPVAAERQLLDQVGD